MAKDWKCQNCGELYELKELHTILNPEERFDDESPHTDWECPDPDCGAVVYPLKTYREWDMLAAIRKVGERWKRELLEDEPIDGADFLDSMQDVLQILKTELAS